MGQVQMVGQLAKIFAVTALIASIVAPHALATDLGGLTRSRGKAIKSAFLVEGTRVAAPFAHIVFCKENPDDCAAPKRTRWGRAPITLTSQRMNQLRLVNSSINHAIAPRNDDAAMMGGDNWALAPVAGDCEDYAVTKRHALIAAGWPARTLRLAITYTSFGEGHLVLVVKTSTGDMVMDNRIDAIRKWNKSGLRWRMIQASFNPRKWLTL
jgi:predicted transglutaminase-like cysteine proteinase